MRLLLELLPVVLEVVDPPYADSNPTEELDIIVELLLELLLVALEVVEPP